MRVLLKIEMGNVIYWNWHIPQQLFGQHKDIKLLNRFNSIADHLIQSVWATVFLLKQNEVDATRWGEKLHKNKTMDNQLYQISL